MDGYEEEIARRSGGPFSNRKERQVIRCASEHWVEAQRYYAERRRRFSTYAWWIGLGTPVVLAAIKIIESFVIK